MLYTWFMISSKILLYIEGAAPSVGTLRVPCFNYSEAALVECYFREHFQIDRICFENRKTGETHPEIIRAAAEYVYAKKPRMFRSKASGKPSQYLITATARRILVPLHQKNTSEIVREQARKM